MYINPFVAGILCTLGVELAVFVGVLIWYAIRKEKNNV